VRGDVDLKWFEVWSKRTLNTNLESTLQQLLAADGMDTAFGAMTESSWLLFARRVASTLGINEAKHTLFEVGCGGGAFLYPFYQLGHSVRGIDQSESLIDIAQSFLPNGKFTVNFADDFVDEKSDFVLSVGVFLYFSDTDYAEKVLHKMYSSANKAIAILDVPDLSKKEHAERKRRDIMSIEEYQNKYDGLNHLYYDKNWFIRQIEVMGFTKYLIEDQSIEGYENSNYRFNVFAWK
jgi:SAM-dependent methyltransferase